VSNHQDSKDDWEVVAGELVAVNSAHDIGKGKVNQIMVRLVEGIGIEGDFHAGKKRHRQLSLLGVERIRSFVDQGLIAEPGSLGENLTVQGFDLESLPLGARVTIGEGPSAVVLDISHRGKFCSSAMKALGTDDKTILEIDRIYAGVIKGGDIEAGQKIRVEIPPEGQQVSVFQKKV